MRYITAFLFSVLLLTSNIPSYGSGPESLFKEKCSICHTLGNGDSVGPDLKDVGKRRSASWIRSFIKDPEGFIKSNPEARKLSERYPADMLDLGLSDEQIDALVNFLIKAGQREVEKEKESEGEGELIHGDKSRGEKLFLGRIPFSRGGPPCVACHKFKKWGPLGGGTLAAPISSDVVSLDLLLSPPFPIMDSVYKSHPLTKQEAEDLMAFFNLSQEGSPSYLYVPISLILIVVGLALGPIIKKF